MSKHLSVSAAVTIAMVMAFPIAAQAHDCLGLDRVGNGAARVVDGTGRAVLRVGHEVVRAGDCVLRLILCDRHRA